VVLCFEHLKRKYCKKALISVVDKPVLFSSIDLIKSQKNHKVNRKSN